MRLGNYARKAGIPRLQSQSFFLLESDQVPWPWGPDCAAARGVRKDSPGRVVCPVVASNNKFTNDEIINEIISQTYKYRLSEFKTMSTIKLVLLHS